MSLNMIEQEVIGAIEILKIEDEVQLFTGEKRECILAELQEKFIVGNPRVWWLSLKHKPIVYSFVQEDPDEEFVYPHEKIIDFFDLEEIVWFVIEDEPLLLKTTVSHVIEIIENCIPFEYNLVSENYDRLLCETDHDDLLFVDLRLL